MSTLKTPFRYDFVGSFLRPQKLKDAKADFAAGKITQDELEKITDDCVRDIVAKQKAAGFHAITDGELRRKFWHLDFMWGLQGLQEITLDHGYIFHGEETTPGSVQVVGKISGENHPFVEHFKFVKQFEDDNTVARQTIPAPAQLYAELFREENGKATRAVYPDDDALLSDIAAAYRQVIADLYAAGCRNVQLDDCTWGMFCDAGYQQFLASTGAKLEDQAEKYLRLNNAALEGKPADLVVTTHVCRGNYHSTWASSGGYAPIAPILFAKAHVDGFYLEFDDARSGDFAPLQFVAPGKKVVLGLVTTKSPVLEDPEAVKARIAQAAELVPLENLCLSPQCGFASCEIGNKLTDDEQWAKLNLVRTIARQVW